MSEDEGLCWFCEDVAVGRSRVPTCQAHEQAQPRLMAQLEEAKALLWRVREEVGDFTDSEGICPLSDGRWGDGTPNLEGDIEAFLARTEAKPESEPANRIEWYAPGFVEVERPKPSEFTGIGGLMNLDGVDRWRGQRDFHRFSQTDQSKAGGRPALMAELEDGYVWWVVGFLDRPVEGLPTWVAKYRRTEAKP